MWLQPLLSRVAGMGGMTGVIPDQWHAGVQSETAFLLSPSFQETEAVCAAVEVDLCARLKTQEAEKVA